MSEKETYVQREMGFGIDFEGMLTLQLHNPVVGSGVREILPLSSHRRHSGGGLGPSHAPGVTASGNMAAQSGGGRKTKPRHALKHAHEHAHVRKHARKHARKHTRRRETRKRAEIHRIAIVLKACGWSEENIKGGERAKRRKKIKTRVRLCSLLKSKELSFHQPFYEPSVRSFVVFASKLR